MIDEQKIINEVQQLINLEMGTSNECFSELAEDIVQLILTNINTNKWKT